MYLWSHVFAKRRLHYVLVTNQPLIGCVSYSKSVFWFNADHLAAPLGFRCLLLGAVNLPVEMIFISRRARTPKFSFDGFGNNCQTTGLDRWDIVGVYIVKTNCNTMIKQCMWKWHDAMANLLLLVIIVLLSYNPRGSWSTLIIMHWFICCCF
jgi:hypothetical protein